MRQAVVNGVLSAAILSVVGMAERLCRAEVAAPLPKEVMAVWDLDRAHREVTPTRERICINGLWRWQPTEAKNQKVPTDRWGEWHCRLQTPRSHGFTFFRVPLVVVRVGVA